MKRAELLPRLPARYRELEKAGMRYFENVPTTRTHLEIQRIDRFVLEALRRAGQPLAYHRLIQECELREYLRRCSDYHTDLNVVLVLEVNGRRYRLPRHSSRENPVTREAARAAYKRLHEGAARRQAYEVWKT